MYWDLNWTPTQTRGAGGNEKIDGTSYKVITQTKDQVELSFSRIWIPSMAKRAPLNIDKRYVLLRGSPGFYTYAIYEKVKGFPSFNLDENRIVFKLNKEKFRYMAMSDDRQRRMPLFEDRSPKRSKPLAFPEAVHIVNPVEPEFKGQVDDKYQYACENKDSKVHGWISTNPQIGFWIITPSNEFQTGGPTKQDLTSHAGPISLAMFVSAHYAGNDLAVKLDNAEPWKKVFGPVFIYLNSIPGPPPTLWNDAKKQMGVETGKWPYNFVASKDYQQANQRGTIRGRLLVDDSGKQIPANGAYVGLALPGEPGSWQRESKGYQFWTTTDKEGHFSINNIIVGTYNVYAWVPGFIGDYKSPSTINITPGGNIEVGNHVFKPPRDGPTLWEIGIPDRSAGEFNIPDPDPTYNNPFLAKGPNRFKQYGLWERYTTLYPHGDLVFKIGVNDYKKDWFFAHVTRKKPDNTYGSTTWTITFMLKDVINNGTYKLRLALASATLSDLHVRVNNPNNNVKALFSTGTIGGDSAIPRHGIHGLYWLFSVNISGSTLQPNKDNSIYLTQKNAATAFPGVMYDYVRLEGPPR
ncbi:uncharacterized protein [Rutidosis leptorrhynchoides]|uniref:uncharacterized protein isoform X1 n=1 Tax=Rutidosis leptorrhynchoides TaxID=125765 RepID=UPI003A99F230